MRLRVGYFRRAAVAVALSLGLVVAAITAALVTASPAQAQQIIVQGNQRVDAETIRSYFRVAPGERLDAAKIDEALKALLATGLYEDVRITQSGGRIIVTVVENPTINRVAFEGNRKVKSETLAAEVQSRARAPLSRPTVQSDVLRIIEVYRRQGYYNVRVDPKIIQQPNNRVDLVFEINENQKTTVRRIVFIGNNAFSDWRLRDVINTGTTNILSWLGTKDVYDPDRVSADLELLRRFYLKHGYADFRVISATADLDQSLGGFVITIRVEEGEQYRFGAIELISNIRDADPNELRRLLHVRQGATYNAELVEKSIEDLTIEMAKRGYAFAQVRPRGDRNFEQRIINIVFVIEQGPRVYVERINIRGNTRTRDWVIRREFDLLEGDPYNRVLVDRAERRLRNLGYFKTVRITNEPGSAPDRVVVNVEVEEQLTGEFSVGGGYSTADGFIGEVSVAERNFLGRGHFVRIAGAYGQRVRSGEFSFTEPYFLDMRMSAGFDIYARQSLRSTYSPVDVRTVGVTLRAGMPLREELTFAPRYAIYERQITLDPAVVPSLAFTQQAGKRLASVLGYSLTYNTLDDNTNPTRGFHAVLSQEFAGVGGDIRFIRTTGEARYYYPITTTFTGMVKASAGHVAPWGGSQLYILDHFFQGPNLVRGFAPSGIGPRDVGSPTLDALGGSLFWGLTAEIIFPFPLAPKEFGLQGAVFADAGSLWNYQGVVLPGMLVRDVNTIRSSIGVSLIWASPFGPLRFDFGYALTKDTFDRTQSFRFGGGARF